MGGGKWPQVKTPKYQNHDLTANASTSRSEEIQNTAAIETFYRKVTY